MAWEPGQKLGPYEIIEKAGEGGMGEVFKARDERLSRTVAIKVLPARIAGLADFEQRFEREAKAISSLNHPNICTLYDIGHQDDHDFLVMEYLEGETLAERILKGPISYKDTLQIAVEIANALDSAHRQGLIHRDLKPGNVMLTKEGAKLMDFGLAKLTADETAPEGMTAITQTTPLTGAGTILGTMQYMAPEQLEGQEADARSDIFAFGAMLYEMSTGKRAFEGSSQATLIAAIIERQPAAISTVLPSTPPVFERLVNKCLDKDADKRWQSAADLSDELRWISQAGSEVGLPARVARRRKFKFTLARVVGAVAISLCLVLSYLYFFQPATQVHTNRFMISPTQETNELRSVNWSRISPNGRLIAFRATDTLGNRMLWIRPMNSLEPYPLRGTENTQRHFWSPDSKNLAFFRGNQLYKIPVNGGPAQLICETFGSDGNWGSAGYILFDGRSNDTLKYVSASGGTPQFATAIDTAAGERSSAWPWFLSDGLHFLYIMYTRSGQQLRVGEIGSDDYTVVFDEAAMNLLESRVEYCHQGFLLFIRDDLLLAQRFDEASHELVGEAKPVAQGVDLTGNASTFGTSDNGTLLYQYTSSSDVSELIWYDRNGLEIAKVGEPAAYREIALSPDNKKLVFGLWDNQGSNEDLWIRDFRRDLVSRLTFDRPNNTLPEWSPDQQFIAYSEWHGAIRIRYKRADGQGQAMPLFEADSALVGGPSHWTKNHGLILNVMGNDLDIQRWNFDSKTMDTLIASSYRELAASLSDDGRFLLYMSNESGRGEIYVSEIGGQGGRWQISTEGGFMPKWSDDNTEIFYYWRDALMAVDVNIDESGFEVGLPEVLFSQPLNMVGTTAGKRYCVSNDGQRILMNVPLRASSDDRIVVVQNWLQEIEE